MTKFKISRGRERQGDKFYHLRLNSGADPFLQFQSKFPFQVMLHETIRNLARNSVVTLLRHCFDWLQHCSNVATLCCAKNRRFESSRVTSPLSNRTIWESREMVWKDADITCTGITLFWTFLCGHCTTTTKKMPNFMFCGRREHQATTLFFFSGTPMQSFRIHATPEKNCQHLTNWWNERDQV